MLRNYLKDKCRIIHINLGEVPRDRVYGNVKNFWYGAVGHDVEILELKTLLKLPAEFKINNKGKWKWYNPYFTRNLECEIVDNNLNKRFSGSHPSAKGHRKISEKIIEIYNKL